jgi:hypothetical protein
MMRDVIEKRGWWGDMIVWRRWGNMIVWWGWWGNKIVWWRWWVSVGLLSLLLLLKGVDNVL